MADINRNKIIEVLNDINSEKKFQFMKLNDIDLSFLDFSNSTFENVDFTNSNFHKSNFENCKFYNCTVTNLCFDCKIDNCIFYESNFNQHNFNEQQELTNIIFKKCNFLTSETDKLNLFFRRCTFEDCCFIQGYFYCEFHFCDFISNDWVQVQYFGSDFYECNLSWCDFQSIKNLELGSGFNKITGPIEFGSTESKKCYISSNLFEHISEIDSKIEFNGGHCVTDNYNLLNQIINRMTQIEDIKKISSYEIKAESQYFEDGKIYYFISERRTHI